MKEIERQKREAMAAQMREDFETRKRLKEMDGMMKRQEEQEALKQFTENALRQELRDKEYKDVRIGIDFCRGSRGTMRLKD